MDKQKVHDYLDKVEIDYLSSASDFDQGIIYQVRKMRMALDSGRFDSDPIPLPTIKPGDRVIHEERGEGVVKEVYGDEIIADYGDVRIGCNKSKLEVSHD